LLDMAPEHRCPARRDGAHDASLDAPEMTGMRLSKRFAMAAEDIRYLQSRSHGTRSYQPGGTTSKRSRSSGLGVLLIVLVATRV
jgi:hypothetical protein